MQGVIRMTGIFGANGVGFSFTGLSGGPSLSPLDMAKALIDAHSNNLGGLDYGALRSGLDTLAAENPALAASVTDHLKTQLGPATYARLMGGEEATAPVNTYTGKPLGPLIGEQSVEDYMRPSLGSATELGDLDGWLKAVKGDNIRGVVEQVKEEIGKEYWVDPALTGKSKAVFSEWSNVATAYRMNSLAGQIDKALAEHDQTGKFTDLKAFSTELRQASVTMDRSLGHTPASTLPGDYSFGNMSYASLGQMVSARMEYNHNQPVLTSTSDAQIAANWRAHQEASYDRQLWTGQGPWTNGEVTSMRYRTNGFDVNTSQAAGTFVSSIDGMAVGGAMRSKGPSRAVQGTPALEAIPARQFSTTGPVVPRQTGTYGELKAQKAKFGETEPMDMDHQPSFASQVAAKEAATGQLLSKAERAQLKLDTPAIASPRKVHQETSPTYGGRNNEARVAKDAVQPDVAQVRDRAIFESGMKPK